MEELVYHGTADVIRQFDHSYSGSNTANNDYDCFFFSDKIQVAEDYGRQAIIRRYEDRDGEELVDYHEELSGSDIEQILDCLEDYAEEALNIITVKITLNNPYVLDLKGAGIDCEKIQLIIGHLKGLIHHDETFEDILYNSGYCTCETEEDLEECCCQFPEYDGLVIKNCIDDIGDASCIIQDEYVAFYNYQITILDQTKLNKVV